MFPRTSARSAFCRLLQQCEEKESTAVTGPVTQGLGDLVPSLDLPQASCTAVSVQLCPHLYCAANNSTKNAVKYRFRYTPFQYQM